MTVTLTHDTTLGRIKVEATGLAGADTASVERSTDQIRWTTVRGGGSVAVAAGTMTLPLYDYEFTPNVANYYRVRGIETAAVVFVSAAGTVSDANAAGSSTLSPTLPASLAVGDTVFIFASIRNSGTGTVNTPTDWTAVASSGNVTLLGRVYDGVWTMPTVTFAGGVANATVMATPFAFRSVSITPSPSPAAQLNSSAQNVAYPTTVVSADNCLAMVFGWKQDDWTSVATLAGMTELLDAAITAGDDVGVVIDYQIQTTATDIAAGSFVVTGGTSAISRGLVVVLPHAPYLNEQTDSVTPTITDVWLKSIARPFLNLTVELAGDTMSMGRPSRAGVFDVVGRSLPVAVSDVRSSRRYTLYFGADTDEEAAAIDFILASGDVLFLQSPSDCPVRSDVYLVAGDTVEDYLVPPDPRRIFTVPVVEVAAPGEDVVAAQSTWQTAINQYASWSDLIADKADWVDVLLLIGDASEVIVS